MTDSSPLEDAAKARNLVAGQVRLVIADPQYIADTLGITLPRAKALYKGEKAYTTDQLMDLAASLDQPIDTFISVLTAAA